MVLQGGSEKFKKWVNTFMFIFECVEEVNHSRNLISNRIQKYFIWYECFCSQVTKLDRDPSSGTALQEISFWLNLERALLKIQDKRESLEVALTLDVLKHGKRFHATVSFDTDTGGQEEGHDVRMWHFVDKY